MYQVPATIGAKYNKDAKYITETKSQWYVPIATEAMDLSLLNHYKNTLVTQIAMWESRYNGAKKKDRKNIDYILEVQRAKLEGYEGMINAKQAGAGGYEPPAVPGEVNEIEKPIKEPQNKNYLWYGAAALALLLILKK